MRLMRLAGALCLIGAMTSPVVAKHHHRHHYTSQRAKRQAVPPETHTTQIVANPIGCPRTEFCGCGAAMRIFGKPIRELWLAANWFRFPRTSPAPGMVAVRKHHVFVLEEKLDRGLWLAYDANSGGHKTRIHARSLKGYIIVDPHDYSDLPSLA